MTIPTMYLWPLGCLTAIGAIHAAFAIEDAVRTFLHVLTKGVATWR
jgi:hypothetical protein